MENLPETDEGHHNGLLRRRAERTVDGRRDDGLGASSRECTLDTVDGETGIAHAAHQNLGLVFTERDLQLRK